MVICVFRGMQISLSFKPSRSLTDFSEVSQYGWVVRIVFPMVLIAMAQQQAQLTGYSLTPFNVIVKPPHKNNNLLGGGEYSRMVISLAHGANAHTPTYFWPSWLRSSDSWLFIVIISTLSWQNYLNWTLLSFVRPVNRPKYIHIDYP